MILVKVQDPKKRGITLDAMATNEFETGGWAFKSYFGSDGEWYERSTNCTDGRVRWFRLKDPSAEEA